MKEGLADPRDAEGIIVTGLVKNPKRLIELAGFPLKWVSTPECRAVLSAAVHIHRDAASRGLLRYATASAIRRRIDEVLLTKTGDKAKDRKRRELRRAASSLLDEASVSESPTEHEFREAMDVVRESAMDEAARVGLLNAVTRYKDKGAAGLSRVLQDLAREVDPSSGPSRQVESLAVGAAEVLVDYVAARKDKGKDRIETPFPRLNEVTGGGAPGRLWVQTAYAKDGKTNTALNLVWQAMVDGRSCFIATGEQTRKDMRTMLVVRHSHRFVTGGLDYQRVEQGRLSPKEERVLKRVVDDLRMSKEYGPVRYFTAPYGTTISDLRAIVDYHSRRRAVEVVMVDHSLLFDPSHRQESETNRVASVVRECKALSLEANESRGAWVILCHQIKREGYENALKRGYYMPYDLAATAEAERSADVIVWTLRTDEMRDMSELLMGVALDRRGPGDIKGWRCWERFSRAAVLPMMEGSL